MKRFSCFFYLDFVDKHTACAGKEVKLKVVTDQ